jgi:hypothetical protein
VGLGRFQTACVLLDDQRGNALLSQELAAEEADRSSAHNQDRDGDVCHVVFRCLAYLAWLWRDRAAEQGRVMVSRFDAEDHLDLDGARILRRRAPTATGRIERADR